jgi:peroxiredoxin
MTKRIFILSIFTLLILNLVLYAGDIGQSAYEKLRTADKLARSNKIKEAVGVYLEAAELYQKALAVEMGNKAFLTNYRYCLGKSAYVPLKNARKLEKSGVFKEAAGFFKQAIEAYDKALLKLPGDKNFIQNRKYCKHHFARCHFQSALLTGGGAPDFELTNVKGGKFKLSNLHGKVVLLEFMTGWCPSCQKSLEVLKKIYREFKNKDLEIILVSVDRVKGWDKGNSEQNIIKSAQVLPFKILWGTAKVCEDYGNFQGVPYILLIDRKGNLKKRINSDRLSVSLIEEIARF